MIYHILYVKPVSKIFNILKKDNSCLLKHLYNKVLFWTKRDASLCFVRWFDIVYILFPYTFNIFNFVLRWQNFLFFVTAMLIFLTSWVQTLSNFEKSSSTSLLKLCFTWIAWYWLWLKSIQNLFKIYGKLIAEVYYTLNNLFT